MENRCPYCGYFSDRATHLEEEVTPEKGDLSFCINCGNVSKFDNNLNLVKINLHKLSFQEKKEIARIKSAWRGIQEVA